jgi:hypothetical protein
LRHNQSHEPTSSDLHPQIAQLRYTTPDMAADVLFLLDVAAAQQAHDDSDRLEHDPHNGAA